MGIKYSMEGFITYLTINTVLTRGFTDHKREKSHIITIADANMQNQHCSCISGYDYINLHLTSLIWRGTRPSFMCF